MKNIGHILLSGITLFSIFFGAGNVIYPLVLGIKTHGYISHGILGFSITAVFLLFLSLLSPVLDSKKYDKYNEFDYFQNLGKWFSFIVISGLLIVIGPFGACPRCVLTAYTGVDVMNIGVPIWAFSFVYCTIVCICAWKEEKIIDTIGKILTPALIIAVCVLIYLGLQSDNVLNILQSDVSKFNNNAFYTGLLEGYNTMDPLGAAFFAGMVIANLNKKVGKNISPKVAACILSMILLATVYALFTVFASANFEVLSKIPIGSEQNIIIHLCAILLGDLSVPFITILLNFVTITTIVALITVFSKFFCFNVCKGKWPYGYFVIGSCIITFLISLIGFYHLQGMIAKMLFFLYPFLIVFIMCKLFKIQSKIILWGLYILLMILMHMPW